jgi:hypothetical protein
MIWFSAVRRTDPIPDIALGNPRLKVEGHAPKPVFEVRGRDSANA